MAVAAVSFLLDSVVQVVNIIKKDPKKEVEKLEMDIHIWKSFLKDYTTRADKSRSLFELFSNVRDVVSDAEDIIDSCLVHNHTANIKWRLNLFRVVARSRILKYNVKDILLQPQFIITDGAPPPHPQPHEAPPLVREDNVVGFEDEVHKIMGYLNEITCKLDVISVIGRPGIGKTTLAGKIFRNEKIQYEFPMRIWVYVSQEFTKKDIYLAILREFTTITEEMQQGEDDELAKMVQVCLEKGKFLIVLDDVRTTEDWDKIKVALPKANNACKVLVTSRHMEVGRHANGDRHPHKLRILTNEESWLLFQYEVFGKPECPPELESFGKLIARQCDGLPLAIEIIGGILFQKLSPPYDMIVNKVVWEKVSSSVKAYLYNEDRYKRHLENVIGYDNLPYSWKECFLYTGMFPKDNEIPVWKLIRLWIAEGFIQQEDGIDLEETAEKCLDGLIERDLVTEAKRGLDGRVKTCRIDGMIHDFCKHKGGMHGEKFLQEIKRTHEGFDSLGCRRISIHSDVLPFISSKPFDPKVRSFVCFSKEDINLTPENASSIPTAFERLRVLEARSIKFSKVPSRSQLPLLRYITLSFNSSVLPSDFANFRFLETLIVDTPSHTLKIEANIWKMNRLRHLKTNASATLPKPKTDSKRGERLQTLGTISPKSCSDKVFKKVWNLKKLGIRGKLSSLLQGKTAPFNTLAELGSLGKLSSHLQGKTAPFNNLAKLGSLEKLKLLNDVSPDPPSKGKLDRLPLVSQILPKLKSLTLANTFLDWSHMSSLAKLEHLEVLKLKDNAFMGKFCWNTQDESFRSLEVLYIGRTDLTIWIAPPRYFPKLKCVKLHSCEELVEVPIGLAYIPSFRSLDLYNCNAAVPSARNILKVKDNRSDHEFKLSIF